MPETRFHTLLKAKIDKLILERALSGFKTPLPDYPGYRQEVGFIEGLETAIVLCGIVEEESGNMKGFGS